MQDRAVIMRKSAIILGVLASLLAIAISISFLNDAEKAPSKTTFNSLRPYQFGMPVKEEIRALGIMLLISAIFGLAGCFLRIKDWGKLAGALLFVVAIVSWYFGIIGLPNNDYRKYIIYLYTLLFIFSSLASFVAPPKTSESLNITNLLKEQDE